MYNKNIGFSSTAPSLYHSSPYSGPHPPHCTLKRCTNTTFLRDKIRKTKHFFTRSTSHQKLTASSSTLNPGINGFLQRGQVKFRQSSHFFKHTLWNKWPQDKRLIFDSGSKWFKQTEHSGSAVVLFSWRHKVPYLTAGYRLWNSSIRYSSGHISFKSASESDKSASENDDWQRPTALMTETIARMIPLTIENERAVFTRSTHSIPSDGVGILEIPIFVF